GRRAWLAALSPFTGSGGVHPLAWGTVLMTKTKLVVACIAILVAVLATLWLHDDPPAVPPAGTANASPNAAPIVAGLPSATGQPAATGSAGTTQRVAAAPVGELAVRGKVLQKGMPLPGVTLTLQWFTGYAIE